MTLPASGSISMSQIRTECGLSGEISPTQNQLRRLCNKPTGEVKLSDFYGLTAFPSPAVDPDEDYSDHTADVPPWEKWTITEEDDDLPASFNGSTLVKIVTIRSTEPGDVHSELELTFSAVSGRVFESVHLDTTGGDIDLDRDDFNVSGGGLIFTYRIPTAEASNGFGYYFSAIEFDVIGEP